MKKELFLLLLTVSVLGAEFAEARTTIFRRSYRPSERSFSHSHTQKTPKKQWHFIISPHPDDEILCCANTIRDILSQEKNSVKIVYITNGDGLSEDNKTASKIYGKQRKKESLKALEKLGIPQENAIFLNFPDGELHRLNDDFALKSRFTGQYMSDIQSFFSMTPYTETALTKNLSDIFNLYPPKTVYIPSEKDTHPDHRVSGTITLNALKNIQKIPGIFTYTIHGSTAPSMKRKNMWKQSLISFFESQFHDTFHKKYLLSFAKKAERFIRIKNS